MKIASVRATWVHVPIPYERQHTSDFGRIASFDSVIVKIDTDDGLVGWGEAKAGVGSAASAYGLAAIINLDYAPLLVGQDPRDVSRLWDVMYNTPREGYAVDRGHVLPQLGRRGLSISAIAGVDLALWDLLGKSLGAPVWRLLGGRRAERMPAYASGGWADEAGIGDQLLGYVSQGGFRAVKMRVGVMDGEPHRSAARVRAARTALGPDVKLMADAHGTWTVSEAKAFCRMVEDCDLYWLEEPVTADDKTGLAEVRRASAVPISTGRASSPGTTSARSRSCARRTCSSPTWPSPAASPRARASAPSPPPTTYAWPRTCGPARPPSRPAWRSPRARARGSSSNTRWAPTRCCTSWSTRSSRWWTGNSRSRTGRDSASPSTRTSCAATRERDPASRGEDHARRSRHDREVGRLWIPLLHAENLIRMDEGLAPSPRGGDDESGATQSVLERSAVVLFPLLLAYTMHVVYTRLGGLDLLWTIWPALVVGWLAGDVLTGIVHWAGDTYGTIETPLLGKAIVFPSRHHHADPKAICAHGFVQTNGNSLILGLVLLPPILWGVLSSSPRSFWGRGSPRW